MGLNEIKNILNTHDLFAKHCGMEITEISEGGAAAEMTIGDMHKNGVGTAHGGAIYTLADYAFACASNSHGNVAVAVSTSIAYHKAAFEGKLTARAVEISRGKRLASYRVDVFNGEDNLVATFNGMVYRKQEKLEDLVKGE